MSVAWSYFYPLVDVSMQDYICCCRLYVCIYATRCCVTRERMSTSRPTNHIFSLARCN